MTVLDELLFIIRTTHEVEHNDNQFVTEFVYSLDESRQAIQQELLKARLDELIWSTGVEYMYDRDRKIIQDRIADLQAQIKGDSDE